MHAWRPTAKIMRGGSSPFRKAGGNGVPTGFDPDRFLTKGPDDGGNGGVEGEDSGGKNSRLKHGRPKKRDNCEDISAQKFFGEKHGEGTPLWYIRRNVYRERWNPGWLWNGNIIPVG